MNTFDAWFYEADMPTKLEDGTWVDLETGLPFSFYLKTTRKAASEKTQDFRKIAKKFGGKALTGSQKQKEWGEKIRAEKIAGMTIEEAKKACDPDGLGRKAHFWIENRNREAAEIGSFFTTQKQMLAHAMKLRETGNELEYKKAAEEYNALTAKWGIR